MIENTIYFPVSRSKWGNTRKKREERQKER